MVDVPTRGKNTPDLYLTDRPTLVNKVAPLSGLSDHGIVNTETNIKPQVSKINPRNVHLYKNADWDGLRHHIAHYKDHVLMNGSIYTNTDNL